MEVRMRIATIATSVLFAVAAFALGRFTASVPTANAAEPMVTFSHFECYTGQINGQFGATVELTDQFQQYQTGVGAAQFFCTPVTKKVISGPNMRVPSPANHLVCYSIQGPTIQQSRAYRDQFVKSTVTVGTPSLLCVPTHKTG
jgi:hypothetical protein